MSNNSKNPGWAGLPQALATFVFLTAASMALASAPVGDSTEDLTLKGNADGTVFRSLTVEGENRVQISFDRPVLALAIDPDQAPGLVLDEAMDILDRTLPDMVSPFMAISAAAETPRAPRPWLTAFVGGPVARFTSDLEDVSDWRLQVVDSRGITAMVFAGRGNPPAETAWDGRRLDGTPAPPGYTYSFVLEARDAAGNQRRIVGDGIGLPGYRWETATGPEFLVSGEQWAEGDGQQQGNSAFLLEAASRFNLRCDPARQLRVIATGRTSAAAEALANAVCAQLRPLVGGNATRVVAETVVEAGAPVAGTLHLLAGPVRQSAVSTR
jgi:hypothetical protein